MADPVQPWRAWGPPIDPPDEGGLPEAVAEQIALANPGANPHLIAALQWEAYAATLAPGPQVLAVTTGAQSVQYAQSGDPFALAIARADWHRSFLGDLASITLATDQAPEWPVDWWQRNLDEVP